jgi:hypothetical protein
MTSRGGSVFLLALFTFTAVLLTASSVRAASPLDYWDPESLAKFMFPNIDEEWLRMPNILYYVLVPFIVAWTVVYGLLNELKIFRSYINWKVNFIIAFCMAFMLLPSGILIYLVTILYSFGTFFAVLCFGVLFILGTFFWARHRYNEWDNESFSVKQWQKTIDNSVKEAENQSKQVVQKQKKQRDEIDSIISNLRRKRADLYRKFGIARTNELRMADELNKRVIEHPEDQNGISKLRSERAKWSSEAESLQMQISSIESTLRQSEMKTV